MHFCSVYCVWGTTKKDEFLFSIVNILTTAQLHSSTYLHFLNYIIHKIGFESIHVCCLLFGSNADVHLDVPVDISISHLLLNHLKAKATIHAGDFPGH
jgi:hypothetical protein